MTNKEKNIQRHNMAVAVYKAMTPEKREEVVAENKANHMKACIALKEVQEQRKARLKAGWEFVRKNNVIIFRGEVGNYYLTAGALLKTIKANDESEKDRVTYKVAYTFCSPKDTVSYRLACGNIGWRLMDDNNNHPYTFYILLTQSGAIIPERLAQLIRLHIEMDAVSKRVEVPAKVQRYLLLGGTSSLNLAKKKGSTSSRQLWKLVKHRRPMGMVESMKRP
jgi:hypothetical protein